MSERIGTVIEALRAARLVDLTPELHADMPFFPGRGAEPFAYVVRNRIEDLGMASATFAMAEHMGAHLDAPAHVVAEGRTVEGIRPERLVTEAVLLDTSAAVAADDDYLLRPDDITTWEIEHGRIPAGALVLIRSGWGARWGEPEAYRNVGPDGKAHHPACSPEAARLLIERDAAGIGIDTLSPDNSASGPGRWPTHKLLLGADRLILENLVNLDQLMPTGIALIIGALPIRGGTGAPARVLAFVDP